MSECEPMTIIVERTSYNRAAKAWLARSGHYLDNPPPGALFAVGVYSAEPGLFGDHVSAGGLRGLCLVGRPVARALPQDGTAAEVTRMVLEPGLPHGTASRVLRYAAAVCARRGVRVLYAYHDRSRHTGCIYRKAGFRRDGVTAPKPGGWASRPGRASGAYEATGKRRWRLDVAAPRSAAKEAANV